MDGFYRIPITSADMEEKSLLLGSVVAEDGYNPDAVIGIWTGGAVVTAYMADVFESRGIDCQSFSAKGKSYGDGMGGQKDEIKIYNMEELVGHLKDIGARRILLGDDVFDTGRTRHAFQRILTCGLRKSDASRKEENKDHGHCKYVFSMEAKNDRYDLAILLKDDITPVDADIRFAAPYYKPYANRTDLYPEYFVQEDDVNEAGQKPWYIFPFNALKSMNNRDLMEYYPVQHMIKSRPELARNVLNSIKRL